MYRVTQKARKTMNIIFSCLSEMILILYMLCSLSDLLRLESYTQPHNNELNWSLPLENIVLYRWLKPFFMENLMAHDLRHPVYIFVLHSADYHAFRSSATCSCLMCSVWYFCDGSTSATYNRLSQERTQTHLMTFLGHGTRNQSSQKSVLEIQNNVSVRI